MGQNKTNKSYEQFSSTNREITERISGFKFQQKISFWMNVLIRWILLLVSVILFSQALRMVKSIEGDDFKQFVAVGATIVGIVILVFILIRDPFAYFRQSYIDLIKLNIILLGFTNQINLISKTVEEGFLDSDEKIKPDYDNLRVEIRESVQEAIEEIDQFVNGFD